MNIQDDDRDARFDAAMRQLHGTAVRRVPGRTLLQLQQRPAAAARPPHAAAARHRFGWPLAASFAVALALVVGLQLQRHEQAPATPPPAATAAVDADDLDTVLDENPDFYLWLASSDANALAME